MQNKFEIPLSIIVALFPALAVYNFILGTNLAFFLLYISLIPLLFFRKKNGFNYDEILFLFCVSLISILGCLLHLVFGAEWFDFILFTHNMYGLLICLIPLCFVTNYINTDVFARTLLLGSALASLILIWQWLSLFITGSFQMNVFIPGLEIYRDIETFTKFRPSSFFTEPAHFSIYVLPAFQIALNQKRHLLTGLYAFSILCSGSATGFVLMSILVVYHLYHIGSKKWYVALLGMVVLMLGIYFIYALLPEIFLKFFDKFESVKDGNSDSRLLGPIDYLSLLQYYEHFCGVTLNQLHNLLVMEGNFTFTKNYANAAIYMYISFGIAGFLVLVNYIVRKFRTTKTTYGFLIIFIGVICSDQILFNGIYLYLVSLVLMTDRLHRVGMTRDVNQDSVSVSDGKRKPN